MEEEIQRKLTKYGKNILKDTKFLKDLSKETRCNIDEIVNGKFSKDKILTDEEIQRMENIQPKDVMR